MINIDNNYDIKMPDIVIDDVDINDDLLLINETLNENTLDLSALIDNTSEIPMENPNE